MLSEKPFGGRMKANRLTALCAGCALALLGTGASRADPASAPEAGVWQKHQYSFNFMGFTSTYSCDGLADKLKVLLTAAGARKDSKAEPGACANGFGRPDKFARATLTFYTLAPQSAAAGASGDQATVSGNWRSITLADRKPSTLHVGDCELVEQFKSSVLPMFSTRNVVNHTTCVPHQESGSLIDLTFDAFTPTPTTAPKAG
jgi:hypothetical protein